MTTTPVPERPSPTTASYILATFIVAACAGYFLGQASSIGLFSSSSSSRKSTQPTSSSSTSSKSKTKSSWPNSYDVTVHPDSSDEELMTHLKGGKTKHGGGGQKKKKKKQKQKKQQEVKDSEDDDDDESESDSSDSNVEESESEARDPTQSQSRGLKMFEENKGEDCKMVLVVRTDLGMGKGKIAAQCAHAALACYKYHLSSSPSSSLLKRWESTGQAKIALQVASLSQMEELRAQAVRVGLCAQVIHDAGRTQIASGSATVLGVGPGPKGVVDGVTGGLRLL